MNDEQIQEHEEETERLAQECAKEKPKQMNLSEMPHGPFENW